MSAQDVPLTGVEFKLLYCLARRPGEACSAAQLAEHAGLLDPMHLYVYIKRLRCKLRDDARRPHILLNSRGVGYRLLPLASPTPEVNV